VNTFDAIKLRIASPDDILKNSHGEVIKPETINYRTQKPEKDGLFDERIFGPTKDWECYCGKYRRIRYKGVVCDKCGVEVTRAIVRRERMGHIKLAVPVAHIWFLRSIPSKIGLMLDVPSNALERVVYYAAYIVMLVDEKAREEALQEIDKEYKQKVKSQNLKVPPGARLAKGGKTDLENLNKARDKAREELKNLHKYQILGESEFHDLSLKYGNIFEAGIGSEVVKKLLEEINLTELAGKLSEEEKTAPLSTRKKVLKRLKLTQSFLKAGMRPEWMFLSILPVLPPDLRPMVPLDGGRFATSDLNDLYRRVINRNNRLKKLLGFSAPEVIVRNEKRMLQEAVDALIDNSARRAQNQAAALASQKRPLRSLADMLKGKQGRFRQNLLGKRVDYSGRSVIVVGPNLELDECGLPKQMALELFKPFVINKIIARELAHNIKGANRLIEEATDDVWAILEEVIQNKYVLLNRAPTLHRLGIQAFKPILVEGLAIRIHPMVCAAFNADFDGDQMAVHLPLSAEAQKEAREIMLSSKNLLKPATGESIVVPTQDSILGVYYLSSIKDGLKGEGQIFSNEQDAVLAYQFGEIDLQAKIKTRIKKTEVREQRKLETEFLTSGNSVSKLVETSVGRILLNQALPEDFEFINETLRSKDIRNTIGKIFAVYGADKTAKILDGIKNIGFEYATKSGISWGMDDLRMPQEKKQIIEEAKKQIDGVEKYYERGLLTAEEKRDRVIEIWKSAIDKIEQLVPPSLDPKGPVFAIIDSKARGSWKQITQMVGLKGLVQNPAGDIIDLPIISSFKEGFNVLEYFISTHGARKGSADTALRTASAGYLTRRLVDVSQDVVITEADCGESDGFVMRKKDGDEFGVGLGARIFGCTAAKDIKNAKGEAIVKAGDIVGRKAGIRIDKEEVLEAVVRSPITCKTKFGICQKCYGYDLGNDEPVEVGTAVGIIAAQAIGEPGTQLTMRTFHTGGVASAADITEGLPRVQEVFEARIPKSKAVISEVDGKIIDIVDSGKQKLIRIAAATKDKEIIEYSVSGDNTLWAKKNDLVVKGQQLSEGNLDLKELFSVSGMQVVAGYILNEVQKVYATNGSDINAKHIEVIIRQMFGRIRVKEAGDTNFTPGDIIEKVTFAEENNRVKKIGGKMATAIQLLMGITKVALTTESWLSAASFQETAKVLINAAVEGKSDKLLGLKENVILGRLIPAGTGYKKQG